jgi:hypothetical protein
MNTNIENISEREEIETLLPWHAAGTLGRRDADRVERALSHDPELAQRFALVREELSETIHLNETLGAPSARSMDRLFSAIDAEGSSARRRPLSFDLGGWIAGFLGQFSPRTLAWSATAAALAIVVQAGILAGMFLTEQKGGSQYQTASYEESRPATTQRGGEAAPGTYVLIRFNPNASVSEITRFFGVNKTSLVEGPRSGGLYRLRVSDQPLSQAEMDQVIAKLGADKDVVAFIVPTR